MNISMKTFALLATSVISGLQLFAQSEGNEAKVDFSNSGRGWSFGLNVGVYYPSKNTANYYNGNPSNVNNVNYVMSNYYWYNAIFNSLRAHDSISVAGLPQDMHYKLAMQPGIYAQYSFNPQMALVIEFNYMKLKANDVIIFEVDPKPYATEKDLRLFPMRGVEERVYGNIGLKRTYPKTDKLSWFVTGGLNINSTKVKKSAFYVEDLLNVEQEYSMINIYGNNSYVPNGNTQTYTVYQGGIGVGVFAGAGLTLKFANSMVIEPGITGNWLMVKLEDYRNMNPGIGAYVRFMY